MAKLTDIRRKVLEHIERHTRDGYTTRVPDAWIDEANQSILEGQSVFVTEGRNPGRLLTNAGRAALLPQDGQGGAER